MACTCEETNFMDGKGHDLGCPLARTEAEMVMFVERTDKGMGISLWSMFMFLVGVGYGWLMWGMKRGG